MWKKEKYFLLSNSYFRNRLIFKIKKFGKKFGKKPWNNRIYMVYFKGEFENQLKYKFYSQ